MPPVNPRACHTQIGVNFLLLLYRSKVSGAILADEMGLGEGGAAAVACASERRGCRWHVGAAKLFFSPRLHSQPSIVPPRSTHPAPGKTAQLITYLGCIRHLENDPGPHLVVVPASLLENWQRELARWCPALKVCVRVTQGAGHPRCRGQQAGRLHKH